jgi:hypothetical protein
MDDLGTFHSGDEGTTLRYERIYPRPIATVWAALTQPERLADWIGLVLPGWHAHLEWLGEALATGHAQSFDMARWRDLQAAYVARYRLQGVMLDPPDGHCD